MFDFVLKRVLAWLAGISPEQWISALSWVRHAATELPKEDRRKFVEAKMLSLWPGLKHSVLNLLIEAAVSYVKKGGL